MAAGCCRTSGLYSGGGERGVESRFQKCSTVPMTRVTSARRRCKSSVRDVQRPAKYPEATHIIAPPSPSLAGTVPLRSIDINSSSNTRSLCANFATLLTVVSTALFALLVAGLPLLCDMHSHSLPAVLMRKRPVVETSAPILAHALHESSQSGSARAVAAPQRPRSIRSRAICAQWCQPGTRERGPVVRRRYRMIGTVIAACSSC